MEKIIVEAWQEVLQMDKIGVNDHFFDIGGNSLNIVQVNTKLKQVLGKELPLMILFRYTTIRSLAQYIDQQRSEAKVKVERGNRKETLKKGKIDRQQRFEKRKTRKAGNNLPGEQRARRKK
jgi:fengycin family lipopeptide synthetase D